MSDYALSGKVVERRKIDVLVLGGGMAGVFAALAAKRPGLSVAIVERSNVLGGQGTMGGVAGFVGDTARVNDAFAALVDRLAAAGKIDPYRSNDDRRAYDLETCGFYLQEMVAEADIEIWLHAVALDAKADGGRVKGVLLSVGPTLVEVEPGVVIDATGNALIAQVLGLPTVHLGPLKQLPMSLYFTLWNTGHKVEPFLPAGCPRWKNDDDLPMTSLHSFADGRVEVKMKVVGFDAADGFSLSRAEIHARRQMMGLIYHLQTRGYHGRHAMNAGTPLDTYTLASVARAIGQREGRRIVGRHCLAEDDIRSAAIFDDAVAVGTYHLDFHWPDTDRRAGTGVTDMVEPYHIPLAAMRPHGIDNVLCPGRSLSGDQMALSSYRAMATCAQMGFGAGHAAALAIAHDGNLDAIDHGDLRRAIEGGGQALDLSVYGDYLRCLRHVEEPVPLVPDAGGNLRLIREHNGLTRIALVRDGTVITSAARHRGRWWADIVWPEETTAALAPAAGRNALVRRITFDVNDTVLSIDSAGPSDADGIDYDKCRLVKRVPGEGADAIELYATQRHDGRCSLVALEFGQQACRYLVVASGIDASVWPDMIATPVGLAIAYADEGGTRYQEGSVERFAPLGAPPPTVTSLKAMPYRDQLLLAHGRSSAS